MILFTAAWRLFFPAAGLFAGLALPLWLLLNAGQTEVISDPLTWHMHEMLFGYLPAALAGFLLTAIPNWTGRPVLKGAPLGLLFGLWLTGRAAMFVAPDAQVSNLVAVLFLPTLAFFAGRDIILAGNKRNLIVVVLIALFSLAEMVMLFGPGDTGITAGFAVAFVLMVLIGGRVTPAFSRNWLMKRGATALPAPFGVIDKAALTLSVVTALAWTGLGESAVTGILAAVTSLAVLARLSRWQAWAVRGEPLLLAQHVAYLWLAVAMTLLALSALSDLATQSQVRHAMGAGAVGSMTLIVMLRAALGHSGRAIRGNAGDWLLFAAVHVGATLRVLSGGMDDPTLALNTAGILWAIAFLLFAARTIPIALTPRQ